MFALIIWSKTGNHKDDVCLKIYAFIFAILICYLNLQHLKKHKILDQVSTESTSRAIVFGPVPNGTLHVHLWSYGLTMDLEVCPLRPRGRRVSHSSF